MMRGGLGGIEGESESEAGARDGWRTARASLVTTQTAQQSTNRSKSKRGYRRSLTPKLWQL